MIDRRTFTTHLSADRHAKASLAQAPAKNVFYASVGPELRSTASTSTTSRWSSESRFTRLTSNMHGLIRRNSICMWSQVMWPWLGGVTGDST